LNLRLLLSLLLGLAILAAVLMRFDLSLVLDVFKRVGFGGFALIVAAGLAAEIVLAVGIYPFLPRGAVPGKVGTGFSGTATKQRLLPLSIVAASRQLRDSSADVLPITQLGGVVLAARALVLAGVAPPLASAAVIADLTTESFAQGLYVLVGVLASLSLLYKSAALSPYVGAMLGGALFLSAGAIGFALAQILGSRLVERISERLFDAKLTQTRDFHSAIRRIYAARTKVALSMLLQFAGWIGSGLWLWVVLTTMGFTHVFWTAIAIQALVEGLRSALVFVPASLGVQEAGYAALAPVFGLPPEIGLAVSLIRRARDIVVAVPVLLIWQMIETRRAAQNA
jgi:putative membrane protein